MHELAAMTESGHRAVVFFLVSRMDAERMVPADAIDPVYGQALREAVSCGVEALAYRAEISELALGVGPRIPLEL